MLTRDILAAVGAAICFTASSELSWIATVRHLHIETAQRTHVNPAETIAITPFCMALLSTRLRLTRGSLRSKIAETHLASRTCSSSFFLIRHSHHGHTLGCFCIAIAAILPLVRDMLRDR